MFLQFKNRIILISKSEIKLITSLRQKKYRLQYGLFVVSARLGNRQAFVASLGRGLGVVESEPRSAAADEVRALLAEVEAALA